MNEPTLQQKERDIAEAMGMNIIPDSEAHYYTSEDLLVCRDEKGGAFVFKPSQDASQNDQVQEHFKIETVYDSEVDQWYAQSGYKRIYCKDRKTAVVLAAWEYIQTKKK